jgi:hypothetical protein
MAFVHTIEIELDETLKAGALKAFLEKVPDTAVLKTVITVIPKDRPFDSERRSATLKARWIEG